jgi:hypothetical protein
MPRTQKLWAGDERGEGRTSTSLVIASMLMAMTMAYVLIVFHPRLVKAVDTAWSTWGGKPGWALSTVAAGAIVAAASLALFLLATVARGVQTAPYIWSAPVLVGSSALGLAQVSVKLPVSGLSAPTFAIASGLLMLVGGGLLQIRGWAFKVSGVLLLTLPVMTLAAGYGMGREGLHGAWQELPNPGRLFVIVLGMTWLSMGLLSLATRPAAVARNAVQMALRWKERARQSELKLAEVEHRARLAEYRLRNGGSPQRPGATAIGLPQSAQSEALSAFAGRPSGGSRYLGGAVVVLMAILATGYVSVVRPLHRKFEMQQALLVAIRNAHSGSLDAVRREFEIERDDLNRKLAAERAANGVLGAAQRVAPQDPGPGRPQNAHEPESAPPHGASATSPRSSGSRRAYRGVKRQQVSTPESGSEQVDDDPIGGLDDL